MPTVSTSTAASAGPKMRDPVITAVFSADGVVDVLRLDELGDEAAPGRVLEGVEHTDRQRERPHDVHRGQAGEVEHTEQQGLQGESALEDHRQRALVPPIGDGSGPGAEQRASGGTAGRP